jgi:hypothetical protein
LRIAEWRLWTFEIAVAIGAIDHFADQSVRGPKDPNQRAKAYNDSITGPSRQPADNGCNGDVAHERRQ